MKSLIVYFTKTGENWFKDGFKDLHVGNCYILAQKLSKLTGGQLYEIEPIEEYPFGYEECCKIAKLEHDLNKRIEYKNKLKSISGYEVFYIVFPCWYGTYPQVVKTFLHDYDFTNKRIKYICSNEGSGLGKTYKDFTKDIPNAIIKKGLSIKGFESDCAKTEEVLKNWVVIN